MSTKKKNPKVQTTNNEKRSTRFHGPVADQDIAAKMITPNLIMTDTLRPRPKLTKLLLNVTVQRSLVPVHVIISPESTVGDLIDAALRQYSKEGRRPIFSSLNHPGFDLHYSQFSLERLSPDEKLNELYSRNFFLCPKQVTSIADHHSGVGIGYGEMSVAPLLSSSRCSKEKEDVTGGEGVWYKLMEFRL